MLYATIWGRGGLGVSIVMGVPLYCWMVDFMENPNLKCFF